MPGFTTNVYEYLKASDYYISASDIEGLANTILESMSVGLPMLLSDIPSHNEILMGLKNRARAVEYKIDHHAPQDICEKIVKILTLDSNVVRANLYKLYQEKYTAQIMSDHYQQIYKKIASKNK